jgi:hypothetical protein
MGAGFRARCGGLRSSDPRAERGGRLHARMFGAGGGYLLCQPSRDARAGPDHRRARTARSDSLRQRAGTNQSSFSGLGHRAEDRAGAHSTGKAHAKCASGKLSRAVAGRVSGGELVREPVRCAAEDRRLAEGVQRRAATQQSGLSHAGGICRSAENARELWKRRTVEKSEERLSHRAWKSRRSGGIPTHYKRAPLEGKVAVVVLPLLTERSAL